jgi:carboxylesterase type B
MVIHVPTSALLNPGTKVPTMVWIHGGSFRVGSASDAGLDGSKLAASSGSIVVTVQYRLGVLGFLPPSSLNSQTNLGVQDIIAALKFLKTVLPAVNGDPAKITLAGQSSGAHMIRALLSSSPANSLWRAGILHSDPMDYGFLPTTAQTKLQDNFYSNTKLACSSTDTNCLKNVSLTTLLSAQVDLYSVASGLDPACGLGEPLRPIRDGTTISTALVDDVYPSSVGPPKPLLITTVANEGGFAIGSNFPAPIPSIYFAGVVQSQMDSSRANAVVSSSFYTVPGTGDDATRETLDKWATDWSWRCSSWSFARTWMNHGGKVWTGQFVKGATYKGNEVIDYCNGKVCHQDDIYILFGTTPSPTPDQTTLTSEIQARWAKFIRDLTPNPTSGGYAAWNQASSSSLNTLKLGGSGAPDLGACDPTFWGGSVQYDYQLYGQ